MFAPGGNLTRELVIARQACYLIRLTDYDDFSVEILLHLATNITKISLLEEKLENYILGPPHTIRLAQGSDLNFELQAFRRL